MFGGKAAGGFTFGGTGQQAGGGFNFGGPATTTSGQIPGGTGISFGTSTPAGTQIAGGPSLGTTNAAASTPAAGFSFGTSTPASNTQVPGGAGGFSFGGTTAASSNPAASTTGGFQLGGATTASSTPSAGGFSFGAQSSSATATTTTASGSVGYNFGAAPGTNLSLGGQPVATPAATTTGVSLGIPSATPTPGAPGFSLPAQQSLTTTGLVPGGFQLPGKPSAAEGQKLGVAQQVTAATAAMATPGFKLGGVSATTTTAAATGLTLGTASTAAASLQQSAAKPTVGYTLGGALGQKPTLGAPAVTGLLPGATTTASTATTTATAGTGAPQKQMNYQQLEEQINKWMTELEKQEKDFLEQATQVNAWDRLLMENGEKITSLNSDMERVKVDQQKLDHELDFITSQQKELEELLVPLEKGVEQLPNVSFQQHTDLERENTYQLAENVDAQLKRMLQDLKEIIDHLNTTNSNQDQNDPIQQITKILNSHMDSLQWIDQNSALLSRKVEEITKQMEIQRKEQESNYRLVYN